MMKKQFCILSLILLLSAPFSASTQNLREGLEHLFTPVRNYVIYQAAEPIVVDGKPDEAAWSKASWTAEFVDIEGDLKPKPLHRTRVKMLWDANNLYVFAELEEPHVWAYYDTNDMIVYHENDFEVFIDPDGNAHDYFEFEVNARNTLFDLFMPRPYRDGARPLVIYNAPGFESAIAIDGTLNDASDRDKKWTVEMKIPFSDLRSGVESEVPEQGEHWRINFSRVQWKTDVVDGRYVRRKNPDTGRPLPEYNWVWSAPGIISMHAPERYGIVQFSTQPVGTTTDDFQPEKHEQLRQYAWLIYYRQKNYQREHGRYADNLQQLDLNDRFTLDGNEPAKLELEASKWQFTVRLTAADGTSFTINDVGLFKTNQK
ncbi:carbohydrate-binding family 9-like protein [uncultured Sunxiuqinia sp.]|uniref:carbohydrate-binding family 9-like protein n=1 Tax=uncultured Sunxiuqinia sp. TaxID=1573825 RepID=UPI0026147C67|nr:carbohydrate-binding family 9-like protein [uncultured Sunxiuqinia sp.]